MSKFIFAYHGGKMPETEEEGARVMAAWNDWYGQMGDANTDGGAPVGQSKTVSADGVADDGGSNPLSGYTLINAGSMDAAVELAKGCPILQSGGTVEVAPAIDM